MLLFTLLLLMSLRHQVWYIATLIVHATAAAAAATAARSFAHAASAAAHAAPVRFAAINIVLRSINSTYRRQALWLTPIKARMKKRKSRVALQGRETNEHQ